MSADSLLPRRARLGRPSAIALSLAAALAFLAPLGAGCRHGPEFSPRLTVLFRYEELGGEATARTILPDLSTECSRLSLSGAGPDKKAFLMDDFSSGGSLEVEPGQWKIEASAYNPQGFELYRGSAEILIKPSADAELAISLRTLPGQGFLDLSLGFPPDLDKACRFLASFSGTSGESELDLAPEPLERSLSLEAGYYACSLRLIYPDGEDSGVAETLRIIAGAHTKLSLDFSALGSALDVGLSLAKDEPLDFTIKPSRIANRELPFYAQGLDLGEETSLTWYKDGLPVAQGRELILSGQTLPATLRLDALAFDLSGRRGGSVSCQANLKTCEYDFPWIGADALNPSAQDGDFGADEVPLIACQAGSLKALVVATVSQASLLGLYDAAGPDPAPRRVADLSVRITQLKKKASFLSLSPGAAYAACGNKASDWLALFDMRGEPRQVAGLKASDLGMEEGCLIQDAAFSPALDRLYVLSSSDRSLRAYELSELLLGAPVEPAWLLSALSGGTSSPPSLKRLEISPNGLLAVLSASGDFIRLIRDMGSQGAISQSINTSSLGAILDGPEDIAFSSDSSYAYVACSASQSILSLSIDGLDQASLIDSLSSADSPDIAVPSGCCYARGPDGLARVLVLCPGSNTIICLDAEAGGLSLGPALPAAKLGLDSISPDSLLRSWGKGLALSKALRIQDGVTESAALIFLPRQGTLGP